MDAAVPSGHVEEGPTLSERERQRLARTAELLPDDATTCLEIGFNDQRISRILERYDVCSIDIPGPRPVTITHKLAYATIAALPFRDRAFELSVCTEVLEHLPDDVLASGVAELARVSSRYLLISVLNRQRVWNELSKCGACGYESNSMGHIHYFDDDRLSALFPDFRPARRAVAGSDSPYVPDVWYRIRTRLGNDWHRCQWGCFRCGATGPVVEPNLLGRVVRSIVWRWEARLPRRDAFLFVLFEDGLRPARGARGRPTAARRRLAAHLRVGAGPGPGPCTKRRAGPRGRTRRDGSDAGRQQRVDALDERGRVVELTALGERRLVEQHVRPVVEARAVEPTPASASAPVRDAD